MGRKSISNDALRRSINEKERATNNENQQFGQFVTMKDFFLESSVS
jgi:hypothetical protein